jgi:uncharacterized membrane protein YobD (UPF0266 family)
MIMESRKFLFIFPFFFRLIHLLFLDAVFYLWNYFPAYDTVQYDRNLSEENTTSIYSFEK